MMTMPTASIPHQIILYLDNYISPLPLPGGGWLFFTDYQDQYVEVDARAFANLFTEAMKYE